MRQTIRNTGKDNIYFVIGEACILPRNYRDTDEGGNVVFRACPLPMEEMECFEQMQKQVLTSRIQDKNLFEEQALFQDILLVNEIDVYRSLSRKVKFAYTFALQQLPTAKWLVKIDDDFFVRIREFEEFITKTFNDTVPTLISGLIAESKPATSGK